MSTTPEQSVAEAAVQYANRGWLVGPLKPLTKEPATAHGYLDFSSEPGAFQFGPRAGIGIATGSPGPTVVDFDDMERMGVAEAVTRLEAAEIPYVVTGRGLHYYFAGADRAGVNHELGGEIKGHGNYVVAAPSIVRQPDDSLHTYTWGREPSGELPELPDWLWELRKSDGAGRGFAEELELVGRGDMYEFLKDRAIRFTRGGITNADEIEALLLAEFELVRVPGIWYGDPVKGARDTRRLAEFYAKSEIAERERADAWAAENSSSLLIDPQQRRNHKAGNSSSSSLLKGRRRNHGRGTSPRIPSHLEGF